ncbi:MAG: glycyl-radical enzyme activating protein [Halobacteriota archaeon]|nr:glycyl-radical enzyme activating protein [Halobacteriota archaeon]
MGEDLIFGVVNDIQRMCTNDGPGIRTTVFIKGCYLDCEWCHNPEGKRRYPEVFPYVSNCTSCGECLSVCPTGALSLDTEGKPHIDKGLCSSCFQCIKACKEDALICWGKIMTVSEVMAEVLQDKLFYENSGGGMTVSGGEPMAQPDFLCGLMESAKKEGIRTALDTCGYAPWEDYERVLEFTDLVLFDIKNMDTKIHKDYSGLGNELILANVRRIADKGIDMRIRIPIIPGRNDSSENMEATAKFVEGLGSSVKGVDLLSYHPFAGAKYRVFGMEYGFPIGEGMADDRVKPILDIFLKHVDEVTVGG